MSDVRRGSRPRFVALAAALVCLGFWSAPASGQALREQVASLITTQPAVVGATADPLAAARSRDTLLGLFGVEMSSTPLTAGTSGFVYQLNRDLGVVERASDSFGAFFTERALRVGHRRTAVGFVVQDASFDAVQGLSLDDGVFPVNAVRTAGVQQPYAVDQLRLQLTTRTYTVRGVYGATDRLDLGAAIPYVQARIDGARVTTATGQPVFQVLREGRSSGIGDASVTARYRLVNEGRAGLALGSDVRLPTGRAADLLGTGSLAVRGQVIASWEDGPLAVAANAGVGVGGASDEVFGSGAVTLAAGPRVTLVGEVMTRRLSDLHRASQVYEPHSTIAGIESMRWVADSTSAVAIGYAVAGVKWNVTGSVLLGANLLFRLTDGGLRARVTPALTLDYDLLR
ncbi:MAG: hypothetical protein H0V80_06150 [Acidobacteria bacterium]|nr:hypothetical protein [Acidobacteriota bacterium]